MKTRAILFFVLLSCVTFTYCTKDGNSHNSNDNPPPPPAPKVSITQTPLNILLPGNCQQSFTITNTGPKGSMLTYTVADDGALGGFLQFNNASGNNALAAGASVTINVTVKPDFANDHGLIGASLVLNVYTPNASNFTKIPVPVNINTVDIIAQSLIGTWSGTWSGATVQLPAAPVSGTWKMNITAADTATSTVTGSITWTGTDAYYDLNAALVERPIDTAIQLNAANTSLSYNAAVPSNAQCKVISLNIACYSNLNYELTFDAGFNTITNTIITGSGSFNTYPADLLSLQQTSKGSVAGSKQ